MVKGYPQVATERALGRGVCLRAGWLKGWLALWSAAGLYTAPGSGKICKEVMRIKSGQGLPAPLRSLTAPRRNRSERVKQVSLDGLHSLGVSVEECKEMLGVEHQPSGSGEPNDYPALSAMHWLILCCGPVGERILL